jgi:hypothetical protein
MGTNTLGKAARATRAGQLIAGARKHFPNAGQVLTFGGGTANVTVDAAVAQLQKLVDYRAAVVEARAAAKDTVQAERAAAPALVAFMNAFEAFVRLQLGADTKALADFGLAPRKARAPMTAEQKAVAAAKRKATRDARGTKGPRAKKTVHGNITAELVVKPAPDAAAGPEAPAPANAPTAAHGGGPTAPPKS